MQVENECWIQLALEMRPMVLMAGELAPGGCMYVIHRGVVMHRTHVLRRGQIWGSDVILCKFELRKYARRHASNMDLVAIRLPCL